MQMVDEVPRTVPPERLTHSYSLPIAHSPTANITCPRQISLALRISLAKRQISPRACSLCIAGTLWQCSPFFTKTTALCATQNHKTWSNRHILAQQNIIVNTLIKNKSFSSKSNHYLSLTYAKGGYYT